jgi:hypothetical protein
MRQLGKVKNDRRARTESPLPGEGEGNGEGSSSARDRYSSKPLTSILSPSTRGEAENLGPTVWCESRKLGNSSALLAQNPG